MPDFRFRISYFGFQVSCFKLQIANFVPHISYFIFRISAPRAPEAGGTAGRWLGEPARKHDTTSSSSNCTRTLYISLVREKPPIVHIEKGPPRDSEGILITHSTLANIRKSWKTQSRHCAQSGTHFEEDLQPSLTEFISDTVDLC